MPEFAKLMRLTLENSRQNTILLQKEIEATELFLLMESLRIRDRFNYQIKIDPAVQTQLKQIPSLLIQPYVENAIWHGLMHKEGQKKIMIDVNKNEAFLECIIQDNGIDREAAA